MLKQEEVHWDFYRSPAEAHDRLATFHLRYNEIRPHRALVPGKGGDPEEEEDDSHENHRPSVQSNCEEKASSIPWSMWNCLLRMVRLAEFFWEILVPPSELSRGKETKMSREQRRLTIEISPTQAMARVRGLAFYCLLALTLPALPATAQVVVGEHIDEEYGTDGRYPVSMGAKSATPDLIWSDTIFYPGAVYIAPHFSFFHLPPGDSLVVRSADGTQHWTYEGLGRADLGMTEEGFFATHIKGDMAVIELYSKHTVESLSPQALDQYGVTVDYYGRGYNDVELAGMWDSGLGEKMNLAKPSALGTALGLGRDAGLHQGRGTATRLHQSDLWLGRLTRSQVLLVHRTSRLYQVARRRSPVDSRHLQLHRLVGRL